MTGTPELVIRVHKMGDVGWESDVQINGDDVGGGTAGTPAGALDVAMDILYGTTNDNLNGDYGALGRLE